MKETNLIEGLANRNSASIKWLIDEYHGYIYAVSYNIVKKKEEAEEATQDALMKILNNIADYDRKKTFKGWIFTIAYRTSIDYYRRKKIVESDEKLIHHSSSYQADEDVLTKEKKLAIEKLLAHLNDEDANLIRLYYLNEMSVKELVEATGLSENNIKIKLYRARKEMAQHIDCYYEKH